MLSLAALVALGLGCGDSQGASGSEASAATFSEIYDEFFPNETNARCNFCHSMPASDKSNGALSLGSDREAAYAALVGKTSSSSHCGGMPLVTPGDPDRSLFYAKLTGKPGCGSRMPLGGKQLSENQLEMVRSWIEAGAHDD